MNEYGDCTREQMLAYLTKIQNLQKKAAGKMTVDVHLLHDSGAILFADFKKDIEQFIKDFDKEWKRRRANYIKRHGKDCVCQ